MNVRILGLGNELLADDGFGFLAAAALGARFPGMVEVRCASTAGFDLLDDARGTERLLVIDTLQTGREPAGTVYQAREGEVASAAGASPHYVGLFEALALGRTLGMAVPAEVVVLAVEPLDTVTVGGPMSRAVSEALPAVLAQGEQIVSAWLAGGDDHPNFNEGVGTSHVEHH